MQCGLLGGKLGHSYSPQIHSYLGEYTYALFEKTPEELAPFLQEGAYTGLNVTLPYKKAVIPYCDTLSECAQKLGAVNTIVKRPDGTLIGHNTDYAGFSSMVAHSGLSVTGKKVLVLGSGGASATVVAVLQETGAIPIVISRSGKDNYTNICKHSDACVIVNATPVGMYPDVGVTPVDLSLFSNLEGVLDVVYNPARTQLLLDAEARGLKIMNGLWMLVAQAKESAEWFMGKPIDNAMISKIHGILRCQMENTVLIGMPGCGKTTVAKKIAMRTGKRFVDADELVEQQAGMPIPEIFSKFGEAGFRAWESKILQQLGKQSGLIIATGGGCVTRKENYPALHQNGRIFWIQRDIASLSIDGRPLSQAGNLSQMYAIRKPMYERFADFVISNHTTPDEAADAICKLEGAYENSCS